MLPPTRQTKNIEQLINKRSFSVDKIKKSEYKESGDYAVVDQGKGLIAGYYTGDKQIYNGKLPVVIYGDHTNAVKYVDFSFICGADGVKVFNFKDGIDAKYMSYVLYHLGPETQGYRRHYSLLKKIELPLPPLPTQLRIVERLDEISASITQSKQSLTQQLAKLDEIRNSSLSQIFDNSEREQVKIENIFKIKSGDFLPKKRMNEEGNIDVYGGNGITGIHNKFNLSGENIIIGRVGAQCGNTRLVLGNIRLTDNAFYISEYLRKDVNKKYLQILLEFSDLRKTANVAAQPVISYKSIRKIELPLPSLSTQQDIVTYLDKLHQHITTLREHYTSQIQHFDELRASTLDQAFTGQLVRE